MTQLLPKQTIRLPHFREITRDVRVIRRKDGLEYGQVTIRGGRTIIARPAGTDTPWRTA